MVTRVEAEAIIYALLGGMPITKSDVLQWDGVRWLVTALAVSVALDDITDVVIASAADLDVLAYEGVTNNRWENTKLSADHIQSGLLKVARGGLNIGAYVIGDVLYASATGIIARRTIGSTNQVLTVIGGVPVWVTPGTGVTDHGALTGLGDDDHPQYGLIGSAETVAGDWTFTNVGMTVPEATITAHEAALTILEAQITDANILARLAANETLTKAWGDTVHDYGDKNSSWTLTGTNSNVQRVNLTGNCTVSLTLVEAVPITLYITYSGSHTLTINGSDYGTAGVPAWTSTNGFMDRVVIELLGNTKTVVDAGMGFLKPAA